MNGDCLELMRTIPDNSIDLVLTDPPYGTTACKWDLIIPFEPMWEQLLRITKKESAIVMFGAEPFSSLLRCSNLKIFKYDLIWVKSKSQHFAQAPYRAMTNHEVISVFSRGGTAKNANPRMNYYPQGLLKSGAVVKGKKATHSAHRMRKTDQQDYVQEFTNYPKTVIEFSNEGKTVHPTQKPVELMEYLVKTYSKEGDVVLDFTMGSGSTGVSAIKNNRNFIGIELDNDYFAMAEQRINEALSC